MKRVTSCYMLYSAPLLILLVLLLLLHSTFSGIIYIVPENFTRNFKDWKPAQT